MTERKYYFGFMCYHVSYFSSHYNRIPYRNNEEKPWLTHGLRNTFHYVWQTLFLLQVLIILALTIFLSPSLQWILNLWKRECDTDISFRAEPLTIPFALHLTDCGSLYCYHLLQKGTLLTTFQGLFSPELHIPPYSSSKPVPKAHKPHNWVYFSNNSTFWYQFPVLVSFLIAIV